MVVSMIRDVMRQFFKEYVGSDYKWNEDPKENKIWIGTVNDYNSNEEIQKFPRILVQRGSIQSSVRTITDEHYDNSPAKDNPKESNDTHMRVVEGQLIVIVETTNEGSCEVLADIVRSFFTLSKSTIESDFGFLAFARSVSMSECIPDKEEKEKFKIQIVIPFMVEEFWVTRLTGVKIKALFMDILSTK